MPNEPLAYLITFHTYGTWLHGDERGSVDREHSQFGQPELDPDHARRSRAQRSLKQTPLTLSAAHRRRAEATILEVCQHRGWTLHALNVRTSHVHVVVSAPHRPEHVLKALKSWIIRRLREAKLIGKTTNVWSRHGSTRYLWNQQAITAACRYVSDAQGPDVPPVRSLTPAALTTALPHTRGPDHSAPSHSRL